ncbi:FcoT family thioesterase [Pendulispora albinea]|uniref:(2E)-enoyl-[ACP] glycyltransferase n=1 Tax=Pendulispora albinea TaxID=2741071 RepID=A0ABZ2M9K8_9BACT
MLATKATNAAEYPVEPEFIEQILRPYVNKGCVYLKSAVTEISEAGVSIYADFSIPESCYIDSTGHFNAVEFNICLNQMFYLACADGVRRKALPAMHAWSVDTFKQKQLPAMLITRLHSRFRKPINAVSFQGKGTIVRMRKLSSKFIHTQTTAVFSDPAGGLADGDIEFAALV